MTSTPRRILKSSSPDPAAAASFSSSSSYSPTTRTHRTPLVVTPASEHCGGDERRCGHLGFAGAAATSPSASTRTRMSTASTNPRSDTAAFTSFASSSVCLPIERAAAPAAADARLGATLASMSPTRTTRKSSGGATDPRLLFQRFQRRRRQPQGRPTMFTFNASFASSSTASKAADDSSDARTTQPRASLELTEREILAVQKSPEEYLAGRDGAQPAHNTT